MARIIQKLIIWGLFIFAIIYCIMLAVGGRPAHATTVTGLPAMGYNTWYESGDTLTETSVLSEAQLMQSDGLIAAGYDIMTLDDGWIGGRTASGILTWNVSKFPHGIPWLARQLQNMGMKLGIYEAIGTQTCKRLPGSYGHYAQDAATFANWGVSFVKVDDCLGLPSGTGPAQLTALFQSYGAQITSRGMLYSEELPVLMPVGSPAYTAAVAASATFANMWRAAPDEHPFDSASYTILGHLADDVNLHGYSGPGHWNDLDMLVPGQVDAHPFNWTLAQEQSQLSVWAEEASPLFVSTNMAELPAEELAALKNPDMIAIDQSGAQAPIALANGGIEAVIKGADGGISILLVNNGIHTAHGVFTLPQLHVRGMHQPYINVWTGTAGTLNSVSVSLQPGTTELLVIR